MERKEESVRYINCLQGVTLRLDRQITGKSLGAFTDSFNHCNIIIIKNDKKLSFTHADIHFPEESIKAEINWMGKLCQKIVVKRNNPTAELIFHNELPTLSNHYLKNKLRQASLAWG